jgi:scytalone dehydratase
MLPRCPRRLHLVILAVSSRQSETYRILNDLISWIPIVRTQHFLGSVVFEQEDEESVVGLWQAQGLHRRTLADGSIASWNAYNYVRHYYRRDAEGKWKLDGLKPSKPLFMDGKPQDVIGKF